MSQVYFVFVFVFVFAFVFAFVFVQRALSVFLTLWTGCPRVLLSILGTPYCGCANNNTNTKYNCNTGQTRKELLEQWVHLTNHTAGHSRPDTTVWLTCVTSIPVFGISYFVFTPYPPLPHAPLRTPYPVDHPHCRA